MNGSEYRMKVEPNGPAEGHGQILQQALGDQAQLDVALVSGQFAAKVLAVIVGLTVRMLRAVAAPDRVHVLHPEVVGVSADGVDGLLEADFDFEAPSVKTNNLQSFQGQIGGKQNQAAAGGMDHPNKAHQPAQRPPDQVKGVIAQHDPGFAIDGAGRLEELLFAAEPIPEPGFHSVKSGPSAPWAFGCRGRKISHAVGANAGDQMMAVGEQSAGKLSGGVISVGHHRQRLVPGQTQEQRAQFVQQGAPVPM